MPGITNAAGFTYIHTIRRTLRIAGVAVPPSWEEENKNGGGSAVS